MADDFATGKTLHDLLHDPTDSHAWERFVKRYTPKLQAWCRQWGLPEQDANDVTQEVLVKLLRGLHSYDRTKRFRSWLKATARHAMCDWLDQRRRAGLPAADEVLFAALDQEGAAASAFEATVDRMLDMEIMLTATKRVQLRVERKTWEAFRRVKLEGASVEDVALDLGLTTQAVYQAVYRVKELLAAEIKTLEGPDETQESKS